MEIAYDGQANAYLFTSYDAATEGSIVNQVQRVFNGLGQLITEYQEHGGAVNVATSPKVQYAWSEMSGGANHSRLVSITYPNGKVVNFNYATGLDNTISRLSSISDSTGTLESYDYLGLSTVVRRAHPQPGVDLTYIKQSGESNGDAGDQYTGLDRFGRVVDHRWIKTSNGTHTDRFGYGYDRNSNRKYRENLTNVLFSELYSNDSLNQLSSFQRGLLNTNKDGIVGFALRSQSWNFDAVGNWTSLTTNGSTQNRTANAQNEYTSISGATTPTYDANGNMTKDETGRQFVYDAWNRLVTVKDSGGTTINSYKVDALGRRISASASGTTIDLYYSAAWQILEERMSGNATAQYVWSPVYVDAMILRDRDTDGNGSLDERLWVQQDANWNVTALLDNSGNVVDRFVYDPYGVVTYLSPVWINRSASSFGWYHLFQGRPLYTLSGLYDFRIRGGYSPSLGRFGQIDPIHFGGGDTNLYRFAENNAVIHVDPSGLASESWLKKGQFMWHWHHMLPQQIFTAERLAKHGLDLDINIADFGWRLRGCDHIGEKGIHPAGWNKDWAEWFGTHERKGVKVTKEMVLKQLDHMKDKYKHILALGKQATRRYGAKAAAKAAAIMAAKRSGSLLKKGVKLLRGAKIVPGLGAIVAIAFWPRDCYCKGFVNGTLNTIADGTPFVGTGKTVAEFIVGDFIPDLEEYDPEVYDAEEHLD